MGAPQLLLAGLGGQAAGGAIQALGSIQQGQAAHDEARYNARQTTAEGQRASDASAYAASAKQSQVMSLLARQRLLIGASGAGSGGTYEDAQASSAGQGELDALTMLYGGQLAKVNADSQASLLRARGRGFRQAGYLGALGGLIGAGSNVATSYGTAKMYSGGGE